jgi:glycosyltransferase involved in cell wall biosynthesis
VLSHEYPPVGGGGGRVIQDLCQGLAERGHELRLMTTHFDRLPRRETVKGVDILRLPCGRKVPYRARFVEMACYILSGLWVGLPLLRAWKPQLMHVHFAVPAGALAWLLSRASGLPYILTIHGGDVPGGAPEKTDRWFRWIYPLTPIIYRSAARVIAVSDHTRALARRHYPVDIQVIQNGIALDSLQPNPLNLGNPPRVIWAGRFMPEKNPLQVVNSLAQLRHLEWHCVMIGDGPQRSLVEREIRRHKLSERFLLTGWLSQDEVMDWFAHSDILFMPSLSEGMPLVGLQGLAMGLAIVASRVGGFVDLVEPHHNGYLVEAQNGEGFVQPLQELLTDQQRLRSFRQASRQVAKQFDSRLMIEAYERVLTEVAGGSQR